MSFPQKIKSVSKWNTILLSIILFLAVVLIIVLFRVKHVNTEHTQLLFLKETQEITFAMNQHTRGLIDVLELIALQIGQTADIFSDQNMQDLSQKSEELSFLRIGLVLPHGEGYTTDGGYSSNFDSYSFFREAIKGEIYLSDTAFWDIGACKYIIISVPIYRNNKIIGVLFAQSDVAAFFILSEIEPHDDNSFILLVENSGEFVNLDGENKQLSGNLLELVKEKVSPAVYDEIKRKVEKERAGSYLFESDSNSYYVAHAPTSIENWHIVKISPGGLFDKFVKYIDFFIILLALFLFVIFAFFVRSIHLLRKLPRDIEIIYGDMYKLFDQSLSAGFIKREESPPGKLLYINDFFNEALGYSREELMEKVKDRFINLLDVQDRYAYLRSIKEQLAQGDYFELDYQTRTKAGEIIYFHEKGRRMKDKYGNNCLFSIIINFTEQKKLFDTSTLVDARNSFILKHHGINVFVLDISSNVLEGTESVFEIFGKGEQFVRNETAPFAKSHIHESDRDALYHLFVLMTHDLQETSCDVRILNKTGDYEWNKVSLFPLASLSGKLRFIIGSIISINEQKNKEIDLLARSTKDPFTALLNKASTEDSICKFLLSYACVASSYAILKLDMDYFKQINDTYGYNVGDEAILYMADTLRAVFRGEKDIIGRTGGNEFIVMVTSPFTHEQALAKAEQIYHALYTKPFYKKGVVISISIGVALFPFDGTSFTDLYASADLALHYSKQNKKGTATLCSQVRG